MLRRNTILLTILFFGSSYGLLGFFEKKTTTKPTTTTTPHPFQKDLGSAVFVPHTDENDQGIIEIPRNHPTTSQTTTSKIQTTTTIHFTLSPTNDGLEKQKTTQDVRSFTTRLPSTTISPKFTIPTKILPSSDRQGSKCPNQIDAFTFGPDDSYAFHDSTVYIIRNDHVADTKPLQELFNEFKGAKVNSALYDIERQVMFLLEEREVFGFKRDAQGQWKLQSVYPKTLPSSVGFTPEAAVRWHNKHQVLLSNGGKFALYDEYWNKSLLSGRTQQYFENLPDHVRGISEWLLGRAHIFTRSLVFEYDADNKSVVGEGKPITDFWRC